MQTRQIEVISEMSDYLHAPVYSAFACCFRHYEEIPDEDLAASDRYSPKTYDRNFVNRKTEKGG